eukprot:g28426.t1
MMAAEVGNDCLLAAAVTVAAPGADSETTVFQSSPQKVSELSSVRPLESESLSPPPAASTPPPPAPLLSEPVVGAAHIPGALALPVPPDEVDSFDGHEFEEEEVEIPLTAPPTNQFAQESVCKRYCQTCLLEVRMFQ